MGVPGEGLKLSAYQVARRVAKQKPCSPNMLGQSSCRVFVGPASSGIEPQPTPLFAEPCDPSPQNNSPPPKQTEKNTERKNKVYALLFFMPIFFFFFFLGGGGGGRVGFVFVTTGRVWKAFSTRSPVSLPASNHLFVEGILFWLVLYQGTQKEK